MDVVFVHHWVQPEHLKLLKRLCRESGEDQAKYPGFVSRRVVISHDDPYKVTTITTWRSRADRDAWWNNPKRHGYGDTAHADIYRRPTQDEWWTVLDDQSIPAQAR